VTLVVYEVLDYFEIKINRGIRGVHKSEGKRLTPERGRGSPSHAGIDDARCRNPLPSASN
jgi:hypothetical protein